MARAEDDGGVTALMLACDKGLAATASVLLSAGASSRLPSERRSGNRAPHFAAASGGVACLRALVDFDARDGSSSGGVGGKEQRRTLGLLSVENGHGDTPLMMAVAGRHFEAARFILEASFGEEGSKRSAEGKGSGDGGDGDAASALLNARNRSGQSAASLAMGLEDTAMLRLLLETHGADPFAIALPSVSQAFGRSEASAKRGGSSSSSSKKGRSGKAKRKTPKKRGGGNSGNDDDAKIDEGGDGRVLGGANSNCGSGSVDDEEDATKACLQIVTEARAQWEAAVALRDEELVESFAENGTNDCEERKKAAKGRSNKGGEALGRRRSRRKRKGCAANETAGGKRDDDEATTSEPTEEASSSDSSDDSDSDDHGSASASGSEGGSGDGEEGEGSEAPPPVASRSPSSLPTPVPPLPDAALSSLSSSFPQIRNIDIHGSGSEASSVVRPLRTTKTFAAAVADEEKDIAAAAAEKGEGIVGDSNGNGDDDDDAAAADEDCWWWPLADASLALPSPEWILSPPRPPQSGDDESGGAGGGGASVEALAEGLSASQLEALAAVLSVRLAAVTEARRLQARRQGVLEGHAAAAAQLGRMQLQMEQQAQQVKLLQQKSPEL
jgi:hypothetical protein